MLFDVINEFQILSSVDDLRKYLCTINEYMCDFLVYNMYGNELYKGCEIIFIFIR